MKLEDLQKKLEDDVKVDSAKLQYEALHNPVIYASWMRIYSDIRKNLLSLEQKKKAIMKERLDFYTGRGDDICMTMYEKSEMKIVMSADEAISRIDGQISYYSIMLDFTSKALDIIKSRSYSIKNAVDIRQLEAGK